MALTQTWDERLNTSYDAAKYNQSWNYGLGLLNTNIDLLDNDYIRIIGAEYDETLGVNLKKTHKLV